VFYIKGTGGYLTSLDRLAVCGTLTKEGQSGPAGINPAVSFGTREFAQTQLEAFNKKFPNNNRFAVVEE
jgi:hypothetical protein